MRIVVYEENLLWSQRLKLAIQAAGHEPVVVSKSGAHPEGEVAIVNLGSRVFPPDELVPTLKAQGSKVIGHAGHKEKPLMVFGQESGCDLVVSNSFLTNHLVKAIQQVLASSPE